MLYETILGIKVISVETNRCVWILGKQESIRVMQLALFQGIAKEHRAATPIEMKTSENPVLQNVQVDPTIVCTSFKKNRFYMFTKQEPEDMKVQILTEIFLMRNLKKSWQLLRLKDPNESHMVPLPTQARETFTSNFFLLSVERQRKTSVFTAEMVIMMDIHFTV